MPAYRALVCLIFTFSGIAPAATQIEAARVPPEMRDSFFAVTVNRRVVDVARAASNYDYASFDTTGAVEISITAAEPDFWAKGVNIEPWRLGIRPRRDGATIRLRLSGPAKLAISRPGDFLNHARMLFLFAGRPPARPPAGPDVTIIPAGVHLESLNPHSGETIYMEPGSYVFGSLNLWKVHDVKVLGRGTIVYDGPQNAYRDEGWMQKPDWHCIGANQAHDVEIDGLTCIVRSRTWSIQMKNSTGFRYNDLRVIGGNPANANQDGMDWLGGGDTVVRGAFIRSSDDVFAVQGNWDGYTQAAMLRPGADVDNIVIEDSELSTGISDIVRINWPQKIFNSRGFTLRNSDILHAGIGACGQTFALLGMWGADGARGDHSGITLANLTVDRWYSLAQIEQQQPVVHDVAFRNIWALDQPPLAASAIAGDVKNVRIDNLKYGQVRVMSAPQIPLAAEGQAEPPRFGPAPQLDARFTVTPQAVEQGKKATFTAKAVPGARYTWSFGDGARARGRQVRHRFNDTDGSELDGQDGAGRFRVLLHVTGAAGQEDWAAQGVVVVSARHDAAPPPAAAEPGLNWKIYAGGWTELPDFEAMAPALTGSSPGLEASSRGLKSWATEWDGLLRVPRDGGYAFHLMDRDGARIAIDGVEVARTGPAFAQVCGSPGNAMRYARGAIGLGAGLHRIRIEALNTASGGAPRLLWEGPGIELEPIPASAFEREPRQ